MNAVEVAATVSAAIAPWVLILMGFSTYLHRHRTATLQKSESKIDQLSERITTAEHNNSKEHAAVRAQISDMATTVATHYIRRDEATEMFKEIREDIKGVHERLNKIMDERHQGWRRS